VRLEGFGKLKESNDLIGTRTRDLPACRIESQPTTLPRTPLKMNVKEIVYDSVDLIHLAQIIDQRRPVGKQ
jgi:hypothetical protein